MVIEVDQRQAVPWMAPTDADEHLLLTLGSETALAHPRGTHDAFVDGSVRFLSAELPAAEWRALISIAGNDARAKSRSRNSAEDSSDSPKPPRQ